MANGKGSGRRPAAVGDSHIASEWDRIFGAEPEHPYSGWNDVARGRISPDIVEVDEPVNPTRYGADLDRRAPASREMHILEWREETRPLQRPAQAPTMDLGSEFIRSLHSMAEIAREPEKQ